MNLFISILNNLDKDDKIKFYWLVFFIISLLILELFSLGLLFPIIKILFSEEKIFILNENFFFNSLDQKNQIISLLIVLVTVYFIKNILNSILIYNKKKFLATMQVNFSSKVFSSYLNENYDYFINLNRVEIIRNMGILRQYVDALENFVNIAIESLILAIVISIIFVNSFETGLFILIFSLTIIFFGNLVFKNRFRKYGELNNIAVKKILNTYLNSLGSIKDIILQKRQSFFLNDFMNNINLQTNANVKNSYLLELPRLIIEVLLVLGVAILITLLLNSNLTKEEIQVTLTITIALTLRAIPSISRIIYQASGLSFKIDTIQRVHKTLRSFKKPLKYPKNKIEFESLKFNNISYEYRGNLQKKVFNNLNLEIKKNEIIGIVGSSGSGKSTFLDLFCCLLNPNKGEIILNNQKLADNDIPNWQNNICYISQKNYLLDDTIINNIAFGENKDNIDINKIDKAIEFSKLKQLVSSKKEGIYFQIGEDGKNLSGGQRQRIMLARATYRDTSILIFDEATSALDHDIEDEILKDIKNNFQGKKTIIISTHRKETLNICNNIIDLDVITKNEK